MIPLAYNARGALLSGDCRQPADSESLQILTIGHVNPNKRVDSVIRAIGASPLLRQRIVYRLVGRAESEVVNSLSALAGKRGVRLVISGEVNEVALSRAIAESDVIACLRWPSLKAASASAIEAMLHGKPVIVTDTGFYYPNSRTRAYLKCPQRKRWIGDLQSLLELLITDQSQRNLVGARGQEWASRTFTADNYARELIDTVEETMKARSTLNAINYFCNVMHQWAHLRAE